MVCQFINRSACLEQIAQHQRCGEVVVHGVVALLAQGLYHALGLSITLVANLNALQVVDGIHQFLVTLLGSLQGLIREIYSATIVG